MAANNVHGCSVSLLAHIVSAILAPWKCAPMFGSSVVWLLGSLTLLITSLTKSSVALFSHKFAAAATHHGGQYRDDDGSPTDDQ